MFVPKLFESGCYADVHRAASSGRTIHLGALTASRALWRCTTTHTRFRAGHRTRRALLVIASRIDARPCRRSALATPCNRPLSKNKSLAPVLFLVCSHAVECMRGPPVPSRATRALNKGH